LRAARINLESSDHPSSHIGRTPHVAQLDARFVVSGFLDPLPRA
jgi:hypothetical protein